MARQLADPLVPLSTLREDVPAALDQAVGRLMALASADRFQSVQEALEALDDALREAESGSPPPSPPASPARTDAASQSPDTGRGAHAPTADTRHPSESATKAPSDPGTREVSQMPGTGETQGTGPRHRSAESLTPDQSAATTHPCVGQPDGRGRNEGAESCWGSGGQPGATGREEGVRSCGEAGRQPEATGREEGVGSCGGWAVVPILAHAPAIPRPPAATWTPLLAVAAWLLISPDAETAASIAGVVALVVLWRHLNRKPNRAKEPFANEQD